MSDETNPAESRKGIYAAALVILAGLAVIFITLYLIKTPSICGAGSQAQVTQEAPVVNVNQNQSTTYKEDTGLKKLDAAIPEKAQPAVAKAPAVEEKPGFKCAFGASTLVITSVVNFSEIRLPFSGIGKEDMELRESHTDRGRVITGTLVTCANLRRNIWIGFDSDYSPEEEDDLKVEIVIQNVHFENGADFKLVACDEGGDNPSECENLNVRDDDSNRYYAVVWPE